MKYLTFAPPPALAGFVRYYWALEHQVSVENPYVHRTMADGCAELIFHYKGRFEEFKPAGSTELSFTSGVHGPTDHFRRFSINQDFGIFGVYLYPFAIPVLFGIPSTEVINEMPDLITFLGKDGDKLENEMMLAPDNLVRVSILNAFLEKRLSSQPTREPAVFSVISQIIKGNGIANVPELAAQSFLSTRQFERKFKAFSGFSPKLFTRIIRFHAAMDAYGDPDRSLTDIAYDCGYYDQSHFIHEFKTFSGEHPKVYFSGRAEGTGYRDA
ncbi:helix-turn-helix domain-containing protein [Dyadobacter sp. CY323]|uniref:helix-turn-helix domain-containing protein n=1 Tax=Dyadobacter sp. CY323 TaxID=2907302 RepID=UPI001F44432A|nr:helix-turn-helix domain-containing protein [Dyadobacter sp. CY323]MCE6990908.1 helix-turn-helix domain-containing protein [Dyadobacter sp. CY323]